VQRYDSLWFGSRITCITTVVMYYFYQLDVADLLFGCYLWLRFGPLFGCWDTKVRRTLDCLSLEYSRLMVSFQDVPRDSKMNRSKKRSHFRGFEILERTAVVQALAEKRSLASLA
jgi:hypothetical protein